MKKSQSLTRTAVPMKEEQPMKNGFRVAVGVVACAMLAAASLNALAAGSALPVYETFESYSGSIGGQGQWSVLPGGGGSVVSGTPGGSVYLGGKALNGSNVVYSVEDNAGSNVWCMLRTKPTMFNQTIPSPALLGASSAALCMSNAGSGLAQIYALNGSSWTPVGNPVNSSGWIGVALKLNYGAHTYDIYSTTNAAFDGEFRRLNTAPLGMYDTGGSKLTNFVVEGKSFSLDNLVVARARKSDGLSNVVAVVDSWTNGENRALGLMPHAYGSSENTLDKQANGLGSDLCMWLPLNDTIGVYINPTIEPFVRDGTPDGWSSSVSPTTTHIEPGTGVTLTKAAPGTVAMFFDYDALTQYTEKQIEGTGGGSYNFLSYDRPTPSGPIGSGNHLGFDGICGTDDRLYFGGKSFYWANGWMESGRPATNTLAARQAFWLNRKSAAGAASWDVGTAQ